MQLYYRGGGRLMGRFIRKRLLTGLLTILLAFVLTFILTRMAPGNPIRVLAGTDNPNPDQIAHLTKYYGLDQPLPVQFVNYLKGLFQGDFGYSYKSHRPVLDIITEKIGATILLSLTASILSVIIGTALGVFSGRRVNTMMDRFFSGISYLIDALPSFWLGMILIIIFSVRLRWFPTSGMYSIRNDHEGFAKILDLIRHMVLPIATIVIIQVPYFFRIARSSVINVLKEDFIMTFRATGMPEHKIFRKYVLRNAIIPVITTFSLSIAFILSGVALIEIVFAWPGMGRVIMDAVTARDHAVLSGVYLMLSISVALVMIITDLIYAFVDPRIRLE